MHVHRFDYLKKLRVTHIKRQRFCLTELENLRKWRHGLIRLSFSSSAGLRRSFRLSRKEKENNLNLNEGKQAEQTEPAEFLTYEEVTKYQQQPGEQQRLVVLIGKIHNWFKIFHVPPSSLITGTPRGFL